MVGIVGYGSFGLITGIVLFVKGMGWMKQKRMVENIPTSKVRSLAMGLVEVVGEVLPWKSKVKSPLSGHECVYFEYTVEQKVKLGKGMSKWVQIQRVQSDVPFYLRDDTGEVLVDPRGAKIHLPVKGTHRSLPGSVSIGLSRRYKEYYIEAGEKIHVLGSAGDNPHVNDASESEGYKDVMIRKGKEDNYYYISNKEEKHLLKSLTWKVGCGLFGGGIIVVGSIAAILYGL